MPSDSHLPNLPPSPIENEDLWLVNRDDKSYKVNSAQLGSYIVQLPIPESCNDTTDCPSGYVCSEGFCIRQPCEIDNDCPANHVCYNGYCYPTCDVNTGVPCSDGYVCVDPGTTNNNPICLPYPFPIDPELPTSDGCPPGYDGYGGYCWHTCSGSSGDCPPGMECVASGWPGMGFICVYPEGGFPCAEGACPDGFECFFGMCFAESGAGGCGEGFAEVTIGGTNYCVPYPFPCDLYVPGCPPDMTCYNGECYPDCPPGGSCESGFTCIDIGNGDNICFPDNPEEKFVNDGPLVFRGEDDSGDTTEAIVFTANQFGRSIVTFPGFDISGPGGGGSGGNINIEINPDWWENSPNSPVYDGPLIFKGEDNVQKSVFTANQKSTSVVDLEGFNVSGSGGNINIEIDPDWWAPTNPDSPITKAALWQDVSGGNYKPTKTNRNIIPNGGGNLGASGAGNGWDNVYTNDLHLSNEGKSNDVDGTWGDWTIQEGEDELFLLNNRNGKKYSFVLKEVIN